MHFFGILKISFCDKRSSFKKRHKLKYYLWETTAGPNTSKVTQGMFIAMDLPPAWCKVCICGRTFSVQQAYTCHKRSCQKTKKRLAGALEKAKEVWQANKRQKREAKATKDSEALALAGPSHPSLTHTVPVPIAEPPTLAPASSRVRFNLMLF